MKKEHLKNYSIDKENGTYTYSGQTYTIVNSDHEIKKIKLYFSIICIINIILIFALGFKYSKLSNIIFYTLPFVFQLFPLVLIISDIYYMFKFNNKLTKLQFNKSYLQFKNSTRTFIFFSIVTIIGLIYIAITHQSLKMVIFELSFEFIILFLNIISINFFNRIKFIIKNETFTEKLWYE